MQSGLTSYITQKTCAIKSEILTYVAFHYIECLISDLRSVNDNFALPGCYAA